MQINKNINNKKSKHIYNNNEISKKNISNKKENSIVNDYLSVKKDTNDFLSNLNEQKDKSEIKREKVSPLINNQMPTKFSKFKKIDELIINNGEKNNNNNIKEEYKYLNETTENDIDINDEYQKMLDKIEEIEEMKMDYNSYSHLNQIKSYINKKGENILIEDINRVNGEIDKMIEILNEKEKLKKLWKIAK